MLNEIRALMESQWSYDKAGFVDTVVHMYHTHKLLGSEPCLLLKIRPGRYNTE